MKNILVTLLSVALISGCAQHDLNGENTCDVANPTVDLAWLKTEIEGHDSSESEIMDHLVYQGVYLGENVFYTEICCPVCGVIPPFIKNCEGETIGQMGVSIDPSDLQRVKLIWRSQNGVCQ